MNLPFENITCYQGRCSMSIASEGKQYGIEEECFHTLFGLLFERDELIFKGILLFNTIWNGR